MKPLALFILFFLFTCFSSYAQDDLNSYKEFSPSYLKTEKNLAHIYHQVMEEYKDDKIFLDALVASQVNWISYRDSELRLKYPHTEENYYGTVYSICASSYLEELTQDRIVHLMSWLNGVEEGDVCAGSIKLNWDVD